MLFIMVEGYLTDGRVPNIYDEYEGYPHWFWAYPSEHLKDPVEKFYDNFKKGLKFVLG
jgi:versiconal hemiacetal acetate esterase